MNYLNSLFRDEKTRDIFDTSLFQRWLYTLMDFFHFHVCSPFFSHNHSLPLSSSYSFVRERGERQIVGTLTVNLSLSLFHLKFPMPASMHCRHSPSAWSCFGIEIRRFELLFRIWPLTYSVTTILMLDWNVRSGLG
jgi:hypothetical protein